MKHAALIPLLAFPLAACAVTPAPPALMAGAIGLPDAAQGVLRLVGPGLATDATDPAQIARISSHVAASRAPVAAALGSASQQPLWRVCTTRACDQTHGMGTRGLTYGNLLVNIGSRAWDDRPTYVHERVHAEMHAPDLMLMRLRHPVPVWFDEGIATLVSGTVGADLTPAECAAHAGRTLPSGPAGFTALTREIGFRESYGAAACRVRAWLSAGHRTQDAIARLRAGQGLP